MDLTEWNYLQRFAQNADEEAFAFLVQRYGPLVLGVCRRQTGDAHLAEDAYQATFLVLARRAGDLRDSESLANWLFGVALRTARQLRSRQHERNKREQDAAGMKTPNEPRTETKIDEAALEPLIDNALAELPERLRQPLVLCALNGKTYEQAATELRLSHDVVRGRIAQARERLREHLERKGVVVPAAVLLSMLGGMGGAALSMEAAKVTAHAAAQWSRGGGLTGAGAANASQMAVEVIHSMTVKTWIGWSTAAATVTLTLGMLAYSAYPARTQSTAVSAAMAATTTERQIPGERILKTHEPAPVVIPEQKKEEDNNMVLGEGAANLLTIADVKFNNVTPLQAAQQLSKQFNVNIHFSEMALETLKENITLELEALTGIEVLGKLAERTNTEIRINDGNVVLALKNEVEEASTAPAILPPKAPDEF